MEQEKERQQATIDRSHQLNQKQMHKQQNFIEEIEVKQMYNQQNFIEEIEVKQMYKQPMSVRLFYYIVCHISTHY